MVDCFVSLRHLVQIVTVLNLFSRFVRQFWVCRNRLEFVWLNCWDLFDVLYRKCFVSCILRCRFRCRWSFYIICPWNFHFLTFPTSLLQKFQTHLVPLCVWRLILVILWRFNGILIILLLFLLIIFRLWFWLWLLFLFLLSIFIILSIYISLRFLGSRKPFLHIFYPISYLISFFLINMWSITFFY